MPIRFIRFHVLFFKEIYEFLTSGFFSPKIKDLFLIGCWRFGPIFVFGLVSGQTYRWQVDVIDFFFLSGPLFFTSGWLDFPEILCGKGRERRVPEWSVSSFLGGTVPLDRYWRLCVCGAGINASIVDRSSRARGQANWWWNNDGQRNKRKKRALELKSGRCHSCVTTFSRRAALLLPEAVFCEANGKIRPLIAWWIEGSRYPQSTRWLTNKCVRLSIIHRRELSLSLWWGHLCGRWHVCPCIGENFFFFKGQISIHLSFIGTRKRFRLNMVSAGELFFFPSALRGSALSLNELLMGLNGIASTDFRIFFFWPAPSEHQKRASWRRWEEHEQPGKISIGRHVYWRNKPSRNRPTKWTDGVAERRKCWITD